jgi:hypothetical protein
MTSPKSSVHEPLGNALVSSNMLEAMRSTVTGRASLRLQSVNNRATPDGRR